MGWLGTAVGFLFGRRNEGEEASTGEKLIEGAASGLDKLFFTEEEKSDVSVATYGKIVDASIKWADLTRNESSIKSVTRRILAIGIMGCFLLDAQIAVGLYLFGKTEMAKGVLEIVTASQLGLLAVATAVFYFGAHWIAKPKALQ
jgi:hypothetical protein